MNTSTCNQISDDYHRSTLVSWNRFLKRIVAMLCLSLMLWFSPAIALAEDINQKADTIINHIHEGKSAEALAAGTVIGGVAGGVGSVALVSTAGISGLSAAGMTSGLAAVGSLVGGGMAAGIVVAAALPAATAVGFGATAYAIYNMVKRHKSVPRPN